MKREKATELSLLADGTSRDVAIYGRDERVVGRKLQLVLTMLEPSMSETRNGCLEVYEVELALAMMLPYMAETRNGWPEVHELELALAVM